MTDKRNKLRKIQKECLERVLHVAEAVELINSEIGGIRGVDFKEGLKFKVLGADGLFNLFIEGLSNRERERYYALAIGSFYRARESGHYQGKNEVHISRDASTKHHLEGIQVIADAYGLRSAS